MHIHEHKKVIWTWVTLRVPRTCRHSHERVPPQRPRTLTLSTEQRRTECVGHLIHSHGWDCL